jgi:hypothetical protein
MRKGQFPNRRGKVRPIDRPVNTQNIAPKITQNNSPNHRFHQKCVLREKCGHRGGGVLVVCLVQRLTRPRKLSPKESRKTIPKITQNGFKCSSVHQLKPVDRLPVHELSAANGHSLRFKYRATSPVKPWPRLPSGSGRFKTANDKSNKYRFHPSFALHIRFAISSSSYRPCSQSRFYCERCTRPLS